MTLNRLSPLAGLELMASKTAEVFKRIGVKPLSSLSADLHLCWELARQDIARVGYNRAAASGDLDLLGIMWSWSAAWHSLGMPTFQLTASLAAALLLTESR